MYIFIYVCIYIYIYIHVYIYIYIYLLAPPWGDQWVSLVGLGGGEGVGWGSSVNPEHILVHSYPPSHQIRSNAASNAPRNTDSYATI